MDANARRLANIFPDVDYDVLVAVLEACRGDLKSAQENLKQMAPSAPPSSSSMRPASAASAPPTNSGATPLGARFRKNWGIGSVFGKKGKADSRQKQEEEDAKLAAMLQRQELDDGRLNMEAVDEEEDAAASAMAHSPVLEVSDELWQSRLFLELLFEEPVFARLFDELDALGRGEDFFAAVHGLDRRSKLKLNRVSAMFSEGLMRKQARAKQRQEEASAGSGSSGSSSTAYASAAPSPLPGESHTPAAASSRPPAPPSRAPHAPPVPPLHAGSLAAPGQSSGAVTPVTPPTPFTAGLLKAGKSEHTAKEILEFAKYLGINPIYEADLLWVAEEALDAELPEGWTEHCDEDGNVFFARDGQSQWEHPMDAHYRQMVKELRADKAKREAEKYGPAAVAKSIVQGARLPSGGGSSRGGPTPRGQDARGRPVDLKAIAELNEAFYQGTADYRD
eukprot:tig00000480_g1326.t1